MAERTRRVTSSDVAAASGVSQATVSYVINNTPGQTISDATRARVLRAVEELGYVPSFAGRTLRQGQTHNILLDMRDTPQGFEAVFVNSFCDILDAHGYTVAVLHASGDAPGSLENLSQALSPVAVVSLAHLPPEQVSFLRRVGVRKIAWVDFDTHASDAAQMMTLTGIAQIEHLHRTGRTDVAYVMPTEKGVQKVAFMRAAGAGKRARELGLRFRVVDGSNDLAELAALLRATLGDAVHPIDAVACFTDQVAFQVLGALHELKVPVPDQVAVIGVNDSPIAPFAIPPLTSVQVPAAKFGEDMALRVLLALGHDVELLGPEAFSFPIAVRDSA